MKKLILGTAQLGDSYGTITKTKKLDYQAAINLILKATSNGICCIDTANSYNNSEKIIGSALSISSEKCRVITKLSPLNHLNNFTTKEDAADAAEKSLKVSLERLKGIKDISILLHRAKHLNEYNSAIWERLVLLKNLGLVTRLGVSVQNRNEAEMALKNKEVSIIQMPVNLLDWRWNSKRFLELIDERCDVEIHARSIYLQGILLRSEECWPKIKNCESKEILNNLDKFVSLFGRKSRADLCLAWVKGQKWIDSVVIGMESEDQLFKNIKLFNEKPLDSIQIKQLNKTMQDMVPEKLLNPSEWLG